MKPRHDMRQMLANRLQEPANDNEPISALSFANPAERRAFVQRLQRQPEPVLNLPQLERLGRVAPEIVPLWKYWRDLQCASASDIYNQPEIFHDFAISGSLRPERGIEAEAEPTNTGFSKGGEQDLECRPSVDELQRAWESAPARRVSVSCTVHDGQRFDVRPTIDPVVIVKGDMTYVGPLVFRRGELIRYGGTARGVPLKPIERLRASKGSRKKPPARDLRWLVQTDAPIVKGAGFLAGEIHTTGKSGAPIECFAEREQVRKAEEQSLRVALGSHAEILDMAVGDSAAREIGQRRGYHGKHAERRGIFLINEAFATLRALIGENILPKAA